MNKKKTNKSLNKLYLKRTGGWTQSLTTLIFILIPSILMWIFLSKDFAEKQILTTGELWAVSVGFLIYSFLISILLIILKIIWIDSLNTIIPTSIVMMSILLSQDLSSWERCLISISLILTAVPVNIITTIFVEIIIKKNTNILK